MFTGRISPSELADAADRFGRSTLRVTKGRWEVSHLAPFSGRLTGWIPRLGRSPVSRVLGKPSLGPEAQASGSTRDGLLIVLRLGFSNCHLVGPFPVV